MGHENWEAIKKVRVTNPPINGILLDETEPPKASCTGCIAGKTKRCMFKTAASRDTRTNCPVEQIHSDLMGPMEVQSIGGASYCCVFTDDKTSFVWVYFLKSKDQTFGKFREFKAMAENPSRRKIKFFHSDHGGEFLSNEFSEYLMEHGIVQETSAPHTPQQNGVAEQMNQTLLRSARAMWEHSGMSKGFWAEAMGSAAHILNRIPRRGLDWRTPFVMDMVIFRTIFLELLVFFMFTLLILHFAY